MQFELVLFQQLSLTTWLCFVDEYIYVYLRIEESTLTRAVVLCQPPCFPRLLPAPSAVPTQDLLATYPILPLIVLVYTDNPQLLRVLM